MKAILITLALALSAPTYAMNSSGIRTAIMCERGYLFLFTWYTSGSNRPPNIVQIWQQGIVRSAPAQPMKCDDSNPPLLTPKRTQ